MHNNARLSIPNIQKARCPVWNHPENARTAELSSLMLRKGTIIIPAEKLGSEGDRFVVSAFILPDNSQCGNGTAGPNSFKRVTVSLSRQQPIGPWAIVLPVVFFLAVIIVPWAILNYQFKHNLHPKQNSQPKYSSVPREEQQPDQQRIASNPPNEGN